MFKNLTEAHFKLIDDKCYFPEAAAAAIAANSISSSRNSNTTTSSFIIDKEMNKAGIFKKKNNNKSVNQTPAKKNGGGEFSENNYSRQRTFTILGNRKHVTAAVEIAKNGKLLLDDGLTLFTRGVKRILELIGAHVPVINPTSLFKVVWDLLSLIILAFFMVVIPLYVTFQ